MSAELDLMLALIDEQAPALFVVDGVGFEGHVESCVAGMVVAIARPAGQRVQRTRRRWRYEQIDDFGRADEPPPGDEDEDPLMAQSRELSARAREYRELSLAEQLLRRRPEREDQ